VLDVKVTAGSTGLIRDFCPRSDLCR